MLDTVLNAETAREEICRVRVELRFHGHTGYACLTATPRESIPEPMLEASSQLQHAGVYTCDNTVPCGARSTFHNAIAKGLRKAKEAILVLRAGGFELEPCDDYQI